MEGTKMFDPSREVKRWLIISFVFVFAVLSLHFLSWTPKAHGMDIEPKIMIGSVHLDEHGVREGNKFMTGASITFSGGDKIYWSLTPEIWKTLESRDEDTEIPNLGYSLYSQVGYRIVKTRDFELTPVIGLNIGRIERGEQNSKWVDPEQWKYSSWTHLTYVFPTFGVNLKYKFLYGKLNLIWPVYWSGDTSNQSSGKIKPHEPHAFVEIGVTHQDVSVGVFRRKMSFDQLESNTYISGVLIGYKF
jgi:hypothetical protein